MALAGSWYGVWLGSDLVAGLPGCRVVWVDWVIVGCVIELGVYEARCGWVVAEFGLSAMQSGYSWAIFVGFVIQG